MSKSMDLWGHVRTEKVEKSRKQSPLPTNNFQGEKRKSRWEINQKKNKWKNNVPHPSFHTQHTVEREKKKENQIITISSSVSVALLFLLYICCLLSPLLFLHLSRFPLYKRFPICGEKIYHFSLFSFSDLGHAARQRTGEAGGGCGPGRRTQRIWSS